MARESAVGNHCNVSGPGQACCLVPGNQAFFLCSKTHYGTRMSFAATRATTFLKMTIRWAVLIAVLATFLFGGGAEILEVRWLGKVLWAIIVTFLDPAKRVAWCQGTKHSFFAVKRITARV